MNDGKSVARSATGQQLRTRSFTFLLGNIEYQAPYLYLSAHRSLETIQHVEIIAGTGTTQIGIFAENGSGGTMSDITFRGGAFGIFGGTQQFTAQRLTFDGCTTGTQIIWD
ncbi:hypothetical protein ACHAPJ_012458 [Fusarium lateritium]